MIRRALVVLVVVGALLPAAPLAAATAGDPIGSFDSISVRAPGWGDQFTSLEIFGWAADPNDDGDGAVAIRAYVDGQHLDTTVVFHDRPDVRQVHPWVGSKAGWQATVRWADNGLVHRVCVYAMNEGAGRSNTTLGCKRVRPGQAAPEDPRGHLDSVEPTPGLIRVRGWAGDPDSSQRPTWVRIHYNGELVAERFAAEIRDDVAAAFPEVGGRTGFNYWLPIFPGRHQVCAYAMNAGRSGLEHPLIGCHHVVVPEEAPPGPHDPRGALDEIVFRTQQFPRGQMIYAEARGWAHDPDGDTHVLLRTLSLTSDIPGYGIRSSEQPAYTDDRRADVASADPPAGVSTGYHDEVMSANHGLHVRVTCAYAHNLGGVTAPRLLGCRSASFWPG